MKRTIILLAILGGLVGLSFWKKSANNARTNSAKLVGAPMRELLLPELRNKANDIRKVRIVDGAKVVSLEINGDHWTVSQRDGYPASFDKIAKIVADLAEQKVSKKTEAGKTALGDLKLQEPDGKKEDAKAGVLLEFLDEKGSKITTLVLGENRKASTVGEQANPFGGGSSERIVRVVGGSDGDTAWWVNNQFYDLSAKAEDWIDKSFIDVKKLKSAEVTFAKAEDSWKASRNEENGQFVFDGAKPGEELDNDKAALSSVLSAASFNDVLTKEKATPDFMKDAVKVKLTTFDGFTYNLLVLKKGEGSDEKHYMSVAVSANIPQARTPGKDEKPEDKKTKDEEFAKTKKELEDTLAKQKKAEGWVFDVSSYTVSALLKKKSELIKTVTAGEKKEDGSTEMKLPVKPMTPPGAPAAPSAGAPKTPISVTTPPVAVPPLPTPPKTEIKPTPSPDANPATGKPNPPPAASAPTPAPAPAASPEPAKPATPPPAAPAPATEPAKK